MMSARGTRRGFVAGMAASSIAAAATKSRGGGQMPGASPAADVVVDVGVGSTPFRAAEQGFVGIYDVDWLVDPSFGAMLDNLAASPGAFTGVRFFGILTAGTPEDYLPETGGEVWVDPDAPIDFSLAFDALAGLTSRGLVPFIPLGFFPPAVSPSPIAPPADWSRWKRLVREFLFGLAEDARFGAEAISGWWFEVWNEPNEGRFWSGSMEDYFEFYRATSEAVVETGLDIRLGGPAIAYKPQENPAFGAPWIDRFLRFVAAEQGLKLDFVSIHRKGTVGSDPPDPRRLYDAARTTAEQMLEIDPARFGWLPVINNEADEKVGFEVPYAPRMHEAGASWLAATAAVHAGLGEEYRATGMRFIGAADNANLQLVRAPFDGRRSIMTLAGDSSDDLVKVPAYAFYEMLRMLGERQETVRSGGEHLFPATDVYHLATSSPAHIGCLLTWYPGPDAVATGTRSITHVVRGIPWARVNVSRFQVDREHSNAYRAAGGSDAVPAPSPALEELAGIREAQELTLFRPVEHDVPVPEVEVREELVLEPYTTVLLWITPHEATPLPAPGWIEVETRDHDVVVRWEPVTSPAFLTYEVWLLDGERPVRRISPETLRGALWVDTAPDAGERRYGVRSVAALGNASPLVVSHLMVVGEM